jgi:hypothetical protein
MADRAIHDPQLPTPLRDLIRTHWGAFLLGNIAPDARVSSGIRREDTHFFEYNATIPTPAMDKLIARNPRLRRAEVGDEHAAFIAGYAAHLAMDEVWCTDLLFPYFMNLWDGKFTSFQMLHICLGYLDSRDYQHLPATHHAALSEAQPSGWLPFIPDQALEAWKTLVVGQLPPDGVSLTLEILGQRIKMAQADMQVFIESEQAMQDYLWRNVPPEQVARVEEAMYQRAIHNLMTYLHPTGKSD